MKTAKILRRLKKLPEKKLIACTYQTGCLFCVIGALLPSTRKYSAEPNSSIEQLFAQDKKVRKQAKRLGLSLSELMSLQKLNDHIVARPKERYRLIVNWIASHS